MCDSCQELNINGVNCHEIGCPDSWKDYEIECFECGCDFVPDERYQNTCNDCMETSYLDLEDEVFGDNE